MRAPPATNNELFAVLGLAAFLAAAILYFQTPKQEQPVQTVVVQPIVKPKKPEMPVDWRLGGASPGWASGRWLGEADFTHQGTMHHPFQDRPGYAGHPLQALPLPVATPGPLGPRGGPRPQSQIGPDSLMMGPLGTPMGAGVGMMGPMRSM